MTMESTVKKSRLGLYLPIAGLLIIALGWSGLWLFGRQRVGQELDNFFAREAGIGRQWSCPDQSISGYPFRIEIRCKEPTFRTDPRSRDTIRGSLGALTIVATTAGAFDMAHIIGEFEGPLVVSEEGFGKSTTTWKSARASFRGHANRLERVSLEIESPASTLEVNGETQFRTNAERLDLHVRSPEDSGQAGSYDIALGLVKAVVPALDALAGDTAPVDLELNARLLNLSSIDRRNWRQSLENWHQNGGAMRVEQFKLMKGAPRLEAKGDLKLDELRRVNGRLDASFVNADTLLGRFGVGIGGGGGAAGILGALLGGNRAQNTPRPERVIRLPLVFDQGRVSVGPFRIPGIQLKPLF
ncbi:MAG: DUF2125 domain-containing protein [Beijerinckiaceae bacterium]